MLSALSQLFIVERHRQRAANVGFSVPAMGECQVPEDASVEPLLTTNMGGNFLLTRVSGEGYARHGFYECPLDQETLLLSEFCRTLVKEGSRAGWDNTSDSIQGALERMRRAGLTPAVVVVPEELLDPPEGLRVVISALPCKALVVADPKDAGSYVRIGGHVSILAQSVDRAFVVVT